MPNIRVSQASLNILRRLKLALGVRSHDAVIRLLAEGCHAEALMDMDALVNLKE